MIAQISWIDALAIAPKYQGQGYGKELFRRVQNSLWRNEASVLRMTVMDSNKHNCVPGVKPRSFKW